MKRWLLVLVFLIVIGLVGACRSPNPPVPPLTPIPTLAPSATAAPTS